MATITLNDVDDKLLAALQSEANAKGTTVEVVVRDRLAAWQEASNEHEERTRELLERLRRGESIDGPLADDLRRARAETGVWVSDAEARAAFGEGNR